jgi:predicted Holliday junction resolvase-like endonuclease
VLAAVVRIFDQFRSIFGICPCCAEVFRLSDTHVYLKGRRPRSVFDDLQRASASLDRAEARLAERDAELRESAHAEGRRLAKRELKRIDPIFSRQGYDPQDAKGIFDPIQYVVFDGMNAGAVRRVVLMDEAPTSERHERLQRSIAAAVRKGNYAWRNVRIAADGKID